MLVAPPSDAAADLIPYRPLTRADFRADEPPLVLPADAPPHGAMTCARIMPRANLATRGTRDDPETRLQGLSFQALMDRDCSHWNDDSGIREEYVLEHEQLHFAIVELEARRLNARAEAIEHDLVQHGSDGARRIQAGLNELMEAAAQDVAEQGLALDRATSMTLAPEAQHEWMARMNRELSAYPPSAER